MDPGTTRWVGLLRNQELIKGTAFTEKERSKLGLHGLVPPHVESLEEQLVRTYEAYKRNESDIYTPVVAQACQQFSHIYRRPRGLFISYFASA